MISKKAANLQASEHERVWVEWDTSEPHSPKIKLLQQHWAEGVGWFTQKTIVMPLDQANELWGQLGHAISQARPVALKPATDSTKDHAVIDLASHRANRAAPALDPDSEQVGLLLDFKTRQKIS